jgi:hypothetical protein
MGALAVSLRGGMLGALSGCRVGCVREAEAASDEGQMRGTGEAEGEDQDEDAHEAEVGRRG